MGKTSEKSSARAGLDLPSNQVNIKARLFHGQLFEWICGWMEGWLTGWMNGWLTGWMDGWFIE